MTRKISEDASQFIDGILSAVGTEFHILMFEDKKGYRWGEISNQYKTLYTINGGWVTYGIAGWNGRINIGNRQMKRLWEVRSNQFEARPSIPSFIPCSLKASQCHKALY